MHHLCTTYALTGVQGYRFGTHPILHLYDKLVLMYYVYLLQSQNHPDKTFVGYTAFLDEALNEHNQADKGYTARFQPWQIIYYEAYQTKTLAKEREKQFKRHANVMVRLKARLYI